MRPVPVVLRLLALALQLSRLGEIYLTKAAAQDTGHGEFLWSTTKTYTKGTGTENGPAFKLSWALVPLHIYFNVSQQTSSTLTLSLALGRISTLAAGGLLQVIRLGAAAAAQRVRLVAALPKWRRSFRLEMENNSVNRVHTSLADHVNDALVLSQDKSRNHRNSSVQTFVFNTSLTRQLSNGFGVAGLPFEAYKRTLPATSVC